MAKTAKPLYIERTSPEPKVEAPKEEKKVNPTHWKDPDAVFADDDESLEARMWRLAQRKSNT